MLEEVNYDVSSTLNDNYGINALDHIFSDDYWSPLPSTKNENNANSNYIQVFLRKPVKIKTYIIEFFDRNILEITIDNLDKNQNIISTKKYKQNSGITNIKIENEETIENVNSVKLTINDWSKKQIKLKVLKAFREHVEDDPGILDFQTKIFLIVLGNIFGLLLIFKILSKRYKKWKEDFKNNNQM